MRFSRIVASAVTLVTRVSDDHLDLLGPDLVDAVRDKAGAMKPGVPCFSVAQNESVSELLLTAARDRGTQLRFVEPLARIRLRQAPQHHLQDTGVGCE